MSTLGKPLRSPLRAFALAALLLIVATVGVVAGANLSGPRIITPRTEDQVTNLDVLRLELKNYYGTPGAATGSAATAGWTLPLNLDSNYAKEARSVAWDGVRYLDNRGHGHGWDSARHDGDHHGSQMRAIVLDVDDTTLTTWNYELYSNWDYNPTTNATFVGLTGTTFTGNMFPATPGMVDLVTRAKADGYAVFFLTGRGDAQHKATIANLVNDVAAGYGSDVTTTGFGNLVPEVDAGYPTPTAVDSGHGATQNGGTTFADGLFTKPGIGDYPAYLNQPQFCGPSITAGTSCPTVQYKSGTRAYIESLGYDIVANFGDQFSDLQGGFADKTFKMPNPNYYLP